VINQLSIILFFLIVVSHHTFLIVVNHWSFLIVVSHQTVGVAHESGSARLYFILANDRALLRVKKLC